MVVDPRYVAIGVLGTCIAFMARGAVLTFPSPTSSSSPSTDSKKKTTSIDAPTPSTAPATAPASSVTQQTRAPPKQPEVKLTRSKSPVVTRKSGPGSITLLPYPDISSSSLPATVVMIIAPERRSVHCKAAAADRFNSAEEFQDGLELARWSRQLIEGVTAAYEASLAQEIEQEAEVYSQPMRRGALPSLYTLMGIDPHSDIVLHDQMALEAALHIADMEPVTPIIFSNNQGYGSAYKSSSE